MQNPYIFDLELEALSLRYAARCGVLILRSLLSSTSGVSFESSPLRVIIPATSFHEVVLSGKAGNTGTLVVRGCFVKAPGGASREFILPLFNGTEEERLSRKKSVIACETGRSKFNGTERFRGQTQRKRNSVSGTSASTISKPFQFLECKVVPEQPLLRIRRTSVTHGAVMLYDGEKYEFFEQKHRLTDVSIDQPYELPLRMYHIYRLIFFDLVLTTQPLPRRSRP